MRLREYSDETLMNIFATRIKLMNANEVVRIDQRDMAYMLHDLRREIMRRDLPFAQLAIDNTQTEINYVSVEDFGYSIDVNNHE